MIDPDRDDLLNDIDLLLYSHMKHLINEGEIDQLNGAIGIGRYFIRRKKYDYVELLIEYLNKTKISDGNEIKWKKDNLQLQNVFSYDFSLAHGSAGIIHFLFTCYKKDIAKDTCLSLIKGATHFLLNNIQDVDQVGSCFPSSIPCKEYKSGFNNPYLSRLSWCYGDLGIWYVLYHVADLFNDAGLKQKTIHGLLKNTERTSFEQTLVVDAGFCHGSAGIAYLYQKMWQFTQVQDFKDCAQFWLQKTIDYGKQLSEIEGYKFLIGNFEERAYRPCKSLLEGSAGVAIVYLMYLHPQLSNWDECMLLS